MSDKWIDKFNKLGYERVTVVGAGVTGESVARVLSNTGADVFVTDSNQIEKRVKEIFRNRGVDFEENGHTEQALNTELVVVSPGVPPGIDLLNRARAKGIPILGEIELSYWLCPTKKIIAVTGTNGKTTTVNLIGALLNRIDYDASTCGNVGFPFIKSLPNLDEESVPVVEVSSYQLETIERFRPRVGVLLNIAPDHLSRHGSIDNYERVKFRIFENQREEDWAIINSRLDLTDRDVRSQIVTFCGDEIDNFDLFPHNKENLAAGLAAVKALTGDNIEKVIDSEFVDEIFTLPHRLEFVTRINGVEYYNDSKATNPAATIAALESVKKDTWLLLGGRLKREGYESLIASLSDQSVKGICLFGEGEEELGRRLSENGIISFYPCGNMEQALRCASNRANPGQIVLLSPACASFDVFSNYKQRGNLFKRLVHSLDIGNS